MAFENFSELMGGKRSGGHCGDSTTTRLRVLIMCEPYADACHDRRKWGGIMGQCFGKIPLHIVVGSNMVVRTRSSPDTACQQLHPDTSAGSVLEIV